MYIPTWIAFVFIYGCVFITMFTIGHFSVKLLMQLLGG